MSPDNASWLASVRRRIDEAKIAVTSNARLNDSALAELASRLEQVWKDARAQVADEREAA